MTLEDTMPDKKVTRRYVLDKIGKTGAGLLTGHFFFLSLKTAPLAAEPLKSSPTVTKKAATGAGFSPPTVIPKKTSNKQVTRKSIHEKVMVSGSGSDLRIKITGTAGRHCSVFFAKIDKHSAYKPISQGKGVIGSDGFCKIKINTRTFPDDKVFVRVITSSSSDFKKNIKGTQAFKVIINRGAISEFV